MRKIIFSLLAMSALTGATFAADTCEIVTTDTEGVLPFSTSISCSGEPSGKTAIAVSRNGKILDAIDSDSQSYEFEDSGVYTFSCYPDVVNNRSNVCKATVTVSGDCGNDVEESDEQCDDGNTLSGDGCSRTCQLEGEGSTSDDGAICGNAIKETGEQCDDGNTENGDACTNICQSTTPTTGPVFFLMILLALSLGGAGYYFYQKRKNTV